MNQLTAKCERIKVMGIDLGKSSFQVHGVDEAGHVVLRAKFSRRRLLGLLEALPPACRIGMEACAGAHYWARVCTRLGHRVGLMAPQYVKPYVKTNKNDVADAEAICEALQRPNMRFVAIKDLAQQDLQSLLRVRRLAVGQRTALANQVRALLLEYGIALPQGRQRLRQALPEVLEDADNELSAELRALLSDLYQELAHLDERIDAYQARLEHLAREHPLVRELLPIPGIGVLGASALVASVGDARHYPNARAMAAALGLVPRQHSTGGKPRLLGISKRGDGEPRMLLIHGARAALRTAPRNSDRTSRWALSVQARRNTNIATVALANKNARIAWAVLTQAQPYQCPPALAA